MPRAPRLIATPLKPFERAALKAALVRAQLPVDDIDVPEHLFWRYETTDDVPGGFGGLELHGRDALLRSLVILPPLRSRGIGAAIAAHLETEAVSHGCTAVWLLTTTASEFFSRLGYEKCDRAKVPDGIRESREVVALCPASADVLVKHLA
jgi:amino-acid N-acetyltransferase